MLRLAILLLSAAAFASDVAFSELEKTMYTDPATGRLMAYRLFNIKPANLTVGQKYPLFIFLHGMGPIGTDGDSHLRTDSMHLIRTEFQASHPMYFLAPQSHGGWPAVERRMIRDIALRLATTLPIDPDRIIISGHSMGSGGVWTCISDFPDFYSCAIPVSLGSAEASANAAAFTSVPVWAFHAANDGSVSVGSSDASVLAMRNAGGRAIYTRYATGGHMVYDEGIQTPLIQDWCYNQRRGQRHAYPQLAVGSPTTTRTHDLAYSTNAPVLPISGTSTQAADVTSVTWVNSRGGSGTATGTGTWNFNTTIYRGENLISLTAHADSWRAALGGETTWNDRLTVVYPAGTQRLTVDLFDNIDSELLADLIADPRFPASPTRSEKLINSDALSVGSYKWGQRMYGYLTAPASGSYGFSVCSPWAFRMRLSTDTDPAHAVQLIDLAKSSFAAPYTWTKYAGQQGTVTLQAGRTYYFEILNQRRFGTDFLACAWKRPGQTAYELIDGQYLSTTPGAISNTAPTISAIADRTTAEDAATGAIAFTVGDAETVVASLVVSATSSNTALVPNANLVLGGSGANRTVAVTPAANQSGSATITVTVSDGSLTTSEAFVLTVSAVNDPPTINAIADRTIAMDASTGALACTIGDVETAAASLTLGAGSSNLVLVPEANIILGGSGANRTVTVNPAVGQSGTATITISVSDGSASASASFLLTVNAVVNTAPTISAVADRTIAEDAVAGPVAITVADGQTAAGALTLTATSSNPALVPNANIVLGGSGANRTVTVTPLPDQNGSATITVVVSDGLLQASEPFILTVTPVNDLPTLSAIPDQSIAVDTATGTIGCTVQDLETAAGALTLSATSSNTTLIPVANVVFGGAGTDRTVVVTPAAGRSGSASITITVSDGTATAQRSFTITVSASGAGGPPVTIDVDFGIAANLSTGNLNNITDFAAGSIADALATDGTSSGIAIAIGDAFLGSAGSGVVNGTVFPSSAQRDYFFVQSTTNALGVVTLANLDPTRVYDITLFASRIATDDRTTSYAIDNVTRTLNAAGNTDQTAQFLNLAPVAGSLAIEVRAGGASAYGYLNAMRIVEHDPAGGNTAPTISAIAARTTVEDTVIGGIAFTIGDAESTAASLAVSVQSSNPALVPLGNITVAGAGASRSIDILPAANQSGSSTITVTVSDGALSSSSVFVLTVSASNDPPTISTIADLTIAQDAATAALVCTISDIETAASALVLSVVSSNTALVPNANVVFGGSGANRTVTVTPAAGQSGVATVTVVVSDGTASVSEPFVLTVTASVANTVPTISAIADVGIAQGGATGAIACTVGDLETAVSALVLSAVSSNPALVPGANIALGGSGANRTITVTPAAGQTGSATITITVSDGAASVSEAFLLTVSPVADATPPSAPAAPIASSSTSATPILSGGTEADATVRIHDGASLIGTVTADGAGAWSWTVSPGLAAGVHHLTVTATDAAGNTSAVSGAVTITVPSSGGGPISVVSGAAGSGSCGAGGLAGLILGSLACGLRRRRHSTSQPPPSCRRKAPGVVP